MKLSTIIRSVAITLCLILPAVLFGQNGNAINLQNLDYKTHGDFIYFGSPEYGFTNQLTVSAWVYWTTDPGSFAVTPDNHENEGAYSTYVAYSAHNSNDITSDHGQFILRNAKTGNKFEFLVENTSNVTVKATSTTSPTSGTWYFLTGVYDGTNIYLYVNGALERTVAQTGNIKTNDGTFRMVMGRLPWGYGFFVGYLDDVRIWKAVLSQSEIQEQMSSTTTIHPTGLASVWNFNAGSGTVIDDSGPQNADGVFYTAAIDVHLNSDFPNEIISDADKSWTVNTWAGQTLKTVSGAGIDETNTVVSNTATTLTLQFGFGGTAPDNKTTPVVDSKLNVNDTWFGIEKSGETSQWIESTAPLPVELKSLTAHAAGNTVVLNWQTATETNNAGFACERRSGAMNRPAVNNNDEWKEVGFVQGNGTSASPKEYSFTDHAPSSGKFDYRLKQIDRNGSFLYSPEITVTISPSAELQLQQNYPNPFNPSTTIRYSLPSSAHVRLTILDVLGREIVPLVNEEQSAGWQEAVWNAEQCSNGVYFYRLTAGDFVEIKRMLLIK